jgi:hypothetical protein
VRIEIDEAHQSEQVSEITDSEYFRSLCGRAARLRAIVKDEDAADDELRDARMPAPRRPTDPPR